MLPRHVLREGLVTGLLGAATVALGGTFLVKLFQGTGFDQYVRDLRERYAKVSIRKPAASRKRSPEVYALAQDKRPTPLSG